ncbi:hypothetical protein ABK040_014152 [Willaertia magna]
MRFLIFTSSLYLFLAASAGVLLSWMFIANDDPWLIDSHSNKELLFGNQNITFDEYFNSLQSNLTTVSPSESVKSILRLHYQFTSMLLFLTSILLLFVVFLAARNRIITLSTHIMFGIWLITFAYLMKPYARTSIHTKLFMIVLISNIIGTVMYILHLVQLQIKKMTEHIKGSHSSNFSCECVASFNSQQQQQLNTCFSIKFSKGNGNYCMTANGDKTIKLFNPFKSFLLLKEYKGHGYEVNDIDISNDNNSFISGSTDKQIYLWDISTGEIKRRFKEHKGKVNVVKLQNDILISGSSDRTVKLFDLKSNNIKSIQTLTDATDSITTLTCTNYEILTGSVDGSIRIYDIRMGKLKTDPFYSSIGHISLTNDNKCYSVTCLDSTIKLIEKDTGKVLQIYKGHLNENYQLKHCFTKNDNYLLIGSENNLIYYFNTMTGEGNTFTNNNNIVNCIDVHPKDNYFVVGTLEGKLELLSYNDGAK